MPRETVIKCSICGDLKNSLTNHWVIGETAYPPNGSIHLFPWTEELSQKLFYKIKLGENFEVCSKPSCLRSAVEKMLFSISSKEFVHETCSVRK